MRLFYTTMNLISRRQEPGVLMAVDTEAALSRYLDQPRVGAGWRGGGQLVATERSAADCTINAGALVFTAGPEALTVLVDPAVVLACPSLRFS